ncbi:galactokinase [Mangrovactinospora gilvigrisea]|uniref:Galactokinase n=1 Tax=Mangrovactinospora gilvigrisea TaxID=1428644 RepID=A0A1J7CGT3_9ACTN|nr:galactokinase [Mangrovactinospora gilvigrisea]
MQRTAAEVAAAFGEVFGGEPAGVWAAPGRANVIGEHTDYNEGFVLPVALPHAAYLAVRPREDGRLRIVSAQMAVDGAGAAVIEADLDAVQPGSPAGWAGHLAGVVWQLRREGHQVPGADLYLDSTVPVGGGMSSSHAIECAVALAYDELFDLGLDRPELARVAQHVENDFIGAPTGILDQMASLCCTEGHAMFLDTRDLSSRQVPLDLVGEGLRLLVVDTLVKHSHADGEYGKRRAGCEAAAAALGVPALRDVPLDGLEAALARLDDPELRRLTRHVVTEDARVEQVVALLDAGRVREIGPLLVEGHASLRDDYRVSVPELDTAVEGALAGGALGARMMGGGFGGSAIVLADADAVEKVAESVKAAFAAAGYREPRVFEAVPSAGARRLG